MIDNAHNKSSKMQFTFDGDVFDLTVVTHNGEHLGAALRSGGKENHLWHDKLVFEWSDTSLGRQKYNNRV